MNTPPPTTELDLLALTTLVAATWGLPPLTLTYQALGFGSHHWRAEAAGGVGECWFVTADEGGGVAGSPAMLARALGTAAAVRDLAGIAEAIAPIPARDGALLATMNDGRWTVAVYPWLAVEPSSFGAFASDDDRADAMRLVARIHAATPLVPAGLPRRDALAIAHRADLERALQRLDTPWEVGPFAEPARLQLRDAEASLNAALAEYDRLVSSVQADPAPWVITHGEPHPGNIVRLRSGGIAIVDWDTCALAPRERDLWQLLPQDTGLEAGLAAYRAVSGDIPVSADALALYRLWWDLSEVAIYTRWFCRAHADAEDMRVGFGGLQEAMENLTQAFPA
ncbi:MAG: phosphotransferase [Thermomicrobiales bacterium]